VFDYWLQEDPEAKYEFRDCEVDQHDSESEARASSQSDPVD
jgi:hypothetical protein